MVVIRLSRGGAKKRPFYTIVVSDRREARDGRCIERIGYFNPIAAGKEVRLHLDPERAAYWMSKGAQPSARVQKLLATYAKDAKATGETASQ
jgi:small subunit ribosomal protein S16